MGAQSCSECGYRACGYPCLLPPGGACPNDIAMLLMYGPSVMKKIGGPPYCVDCGEIEKFEEETEEEISKWPKPSFGDRNR